MEKLVYLGWASEGLGRASAGMAGDVLRDRLLSEVVPAWQAGGAGSVQVAVADAAVGGDGVFSFSSEGTPKDAVVSFWLEVSAERAWAEALLTGVFDAMHGYLVCESRPIVPQAVAAPGDRSVGASQITCIAARPDLSHDEFIARWQGAFCDVAIECQHTIAYVRNEVVRALTDGAPDWWAIVEESFPVEAMTDPAVFYDAQGDPELLAANQARLFESVGELIDLARVDARFYSEYRFEG